MKIPGESMDDYITMLLEYMINIHVYNIYIYMYSLVQNNIDKHNYKMCHDKKGESKITMMMIMIRGKKLNQSKAMIYHKH